MTATASNIVVAGTGTLWVQDAAATITIPTDATTAPGTGFSDLGHYSESGLTMKPSLTVSHIKSTQSGGYDVRTVPKERNLEIEIEVMELRNGKVLPFIFGGGTYTPGTAPAAAYTPPLSGTVDERCVIIDILDGVLKTRLIAIRGLVTAIGDIKFARDGAAMAKVTVTALYPLTGTLPWAMYYA